MDDSAIKLNILVKAGTELRPYREWKVSQTHYPNVFLRNHGIGPTAPAYRKNGRTMTTSEVQWNSWFKVHFSSIGKRAKNSKPGFTPNPKLQQPDTDKLQLENLFQRKIDKNSRHNTNMHSTTSKATTRFTVPRFWQKGKLPKERPWAIWTQKLSCTGHKNSRTRSKTYDHHDVHV